MKLTYLLFILFCMSVSFTPKAQPLPEYCPEPLKLVYYGNWYPYMYAQGDNHQGTDWTFLLKILKVLNCQINVVKIPEKRAHKDLSKRHALVMIAATITKERLKHAYFSKSYRDEVQSIFYLESKDFPPNLASLEYVVAQSNMVAINGAAWYGKRVEALRASARDKHKFIHVPGMKKRIEMMRRDRAQSMVEDYIAGCNYFHQYAQDIAPKLRAITVHQVKVSYMFSKTNVSPAFIKRFDQTMTQLLEQGIYDDILAKFTPVGC